MPLDPLKLKYAQLRTQDPAAALAFAKQNGLPIEELDLSERIKADSLSGVKNLLGVQPGQDGNGYFQKEGMLPSRPIAPVEPTDVQIAERQMLSANAKQAQNDPAFAERLAASRAALQKFKNPPPAPEVPHVSLNPEDLDDEEKLKSIGKKYSAFEK